MRLATCYWTALLACLVGGAGARAGVIVTPPPGPARVVAADAVIVAKVEAIEPKDVKVGTATYRIAVASVSQGLKGAKDDATVRIAFTPPPMPIGKDKGPFVIRTGGRDVELKPGMEGLLLLRKHAKEEFFTIGGQVGWYISKDKNTAFAREVQLVKNVLRVQQNPQASLKAKDADERLLAAAVLIANYRTFHGSPKQEPIDADESRQILQILSDATWPPSKAPIDFNTLLPSPRQLFDQLGVTAKDGFAPAIGDYHTAIRAWLGDNSQKYRIQRFVASEK